MYIYSQAQMYIDCLTMTDDTRFLTKITTHTS